MVNRNSIDISKYVSSHQTVFIHGGSATPSRLIGELVDKRDAFENVNIVHLHTVGEAFYAKKEFRKNFRVSNLFVGSNMRRKFSPGYVDFIPCFLSEVPTMFRSGRLPIDVAFLHVSPPDAHGYCTLGTSVDVALAATQIAKIVIAQINTKMPRVHGDGFIHMSEFDAFIEVDDEIPELPRGAPSKEELRIGKYCAELIEDGSTLQVGIGTIPDAVLSCLKNHRHLGVHSETWSDGVLELIQCGAVDNSRKILHPGKTVSGFVTGSKKLYEFIHDNPSVVQLDIAYVNRVDKIARNPKVIAINSAVEIDLTGQVCADSIGSQIISGVGGQMDFIRGSSLSEGGKPIIAITSRTSKGTSKIVPSLRKGAGVVTTRAHVHYVITEYGHADLYGKTLQQRAEALIQIAHPDEREGLQKSWYELFKNSSY